MAPTRFRKRLFSRYVLLGTFVSHLSCSSALSFNPEDLAKLDHPDVSCARGDFFVAPLAQRNLSGRTLTNARLRGADLRGTDLRRANLRGADLRDTQLEGVQLEGADLYGVSAYGATASEELRRRYPALFIPGRIDFLNTPQRRKDSDLRMLDYASIVEALRPSQEIEGRFIVAYLLDTYGGDEERREAKGLYETLMGEGVLDAATNLGWMYEQMQVPGVGGEEALTKALEFYERCKNVNSKSRGAFHFYRLKSQSGNAQEKPEALYQVGLCFMNGEGVDRDGVAAIPWFERASQLRVSWAPFTLGELYLEGRSGVPRNLSLAKRWFLEAARYDLQAARTYKSTYRNLGYLYEQEGDWHTAFLNYEKAANAGSITSLYHMARMCEFLARDTYYLDRARTFYEMMIQQQPDWSDAYVRLAGLLWRTQERTEALKRKIDTLYEAAAEHGHPLAHIRRELLQGARGEADYEALMNQQKADILRRRHLRHERVQAELAANYKIKGGGQKFKLTQDYAATQEIVRAVADAHATDPLQVNYTAISEDPYLDEYNVDYEATIGNERLEADAVDAFATQIMRDAGVHPAQNPRLMQDLALVLARVFDSLGPTPQKQFLWVYDKWMASQQEQGVDERTARGNFGFLFAQNVGRCSDGLSEFLAEQIDRIRRGEGGPGLSLGGRISQILQAYKQKVLQAHRTPLAGAHEEATEAVALLRQRMRVPLGLVGDFYPPRYPHLGFGQEERYTPAHVMRLFLEGGEIAFTRENQTFVRQIPSGYSPELLVDLLYQDYRKDERDENGRPINPDVRNILTNEIVTQYVTTHPQLNPLYEEAVVNMEPHPYFDLTVSDRIHFFTKDLFKRMLIDFGYLIEAPAAAAAAVGGSA